MKKIIHVFVLLLLLSSCSEPKKFSITFVLDKPLADTKYPDYFQKLAMPFTYNTGVDYLPKPIMISRVDISNKIIETNAWHFKDMGDNTAEFSRGWLEQYFRDSTSSYLMEPSKKEPSIDKFIRDSEDSVFIYSEESEISDYEGRVIFNDVQKLEAAIQETIASTNKGIAIIINPQILQNMEAIDPEPGDVPGTKKPGGAKSGIGANLRRDGTTNTIEWSQELTNAAEKLTIKFKADKADIEYTYDVTDKISFDFSPENKEVPRHLMTVTLIPTLKKGDNRKVGGNKISNQIFSCSQ